MARYSGATWRPVNWANNRDDNTAATVVILHVTASEASSQFGWFNNPANGACSHFHIALNGVVEQYIDTDKLSAADFEGSDNAISIETAGLGSGSWTTAQRLSIARLLAWINRTHSIPLTLKTTSSAAAGIGWHRLGIIGNFPALPSILAGRNQRGYAGEPWSVSQGKVCPGDNRILQIPAIVQDARDINNDPAGGLVAIQDDVDSILWNVRQIKEKIDDILVPNSEEAKPVLWNAREIKEVTDAIPATLNAIKAKTDTL